MATTTATRIPGFRAPWQDGARAYPEADTFAAALTGFKRKRKGVIFHMTNTGEAGDRMCVVCSGTLREAPVQKKISQGRTTIHTGTTVTDVKPDRWSTWDYDAAGKRVGNGRHYTCSWSALMLQIFTTYDRM